MLLEVTVNTFS